MSALCDMNRFEKMMNEYDSCFEKAPSSPHQLVQFSKDREYGFKYKQLKTLLSVWQKNKTKTAETQKVATNESQQKEINFDSFWDEYQTKYGYSPKKAANFWNFLKEEKAVSIKFKAAENEFIRITKERTVKKEEGATGDNMTDFVMARQGMDNNIPLKLKIDKKTSSEQLEAIKVKFCELLQCFRATICDDPRSPLHFYHFVNDRTKYKVSHGDIQFVYNYAVENEWFEPMKRLYKNQKMRVYKEQTDEGSDDNAHSDEGAAEFELVFDAEKKEKIKKKKLKKKVRKAVVRDVMSDDDLDKVLKEYGMAYDNKPKNAAQILNFAKEMGQNYKWKAVRIAFMRWVEFRGGKMPCNEKKE